MIFPCTGGLTPPAASTPLPPLRNPSETGKKKSTISEPSHAINYFPAIQGAFMRAGWVLCCATTLLLTNLAITTHAQMGMDLFKKPAIGKVFHPVVGKGAEYQTINKAASDAKPRSMEMGVVGKESVDGKNGYWMQFVASDNKGQTMVGKSLITVDDFQFHKMIIQPAGQSAMEMPMNFAGRNRDKMQENMNDWHSVGTDTVTVPAGTFACEHWKNDKDGGEIWTSDKVTPFGMVKEVSKDSTMVLVKVLDNVSDRITGPVKQFDMQQMMQQMQQQRQQQQYP
jgi:hypothetical protein